MFDLETIAIFLLLSPVLPYFLPLFSFLGFASIGVLFFVWFAWKSPSTRKLGDSCNTHLTRKKLAYRSPYLPPLPKKLKADGTEDESSSQRGSDDVPLPPLVQQIVGMCLDLTTKAFVHPLFSNLMKPSVVKRGASQKGAGYEDLPSHPTTIIERTFVETVLTPQINKAAASLYSFIVTHRNQNVHVKLATTTLSILQSHVKLFKTLKQEVLSEATSQPSGMDEAIRSKLKASGLLHPSLESGESSEKSFLRKWIKTLVQLIETFGENKKAESKIVRLFVQGWLANQLMYPVLNSFCNPTIINGFVSWHAQKAIRIQRAAKMYRTFLDNQFTTLSVSGFSKGPQFSAAPLAEKIKLLGNIVKYIKKTRSMIDVRALQFQVLSERYRKTAELRALKSADSKADTDLLARSDPSKLTLNSILEEHYQHHTTDGTSTESHSLSPLYAFFRYLDTARVPLAMRKISFWSDCEQYRNLRDEFIAEEYRSVQSLPDIGILAAVTKPEHRSQLRNEAEKLYHEYLVDQQDIGPAIPDAAKSILEFITKNSTMNAWETDDSSCVLLAQDVIKNDLATHFAAFKQSDAYFQWSSEMEKCRLTETEGASENMNNLTGKLVAFHDEERYDGSKLASKEEVEMRNSEFILACRQELSRLGDKPGVKSMKRQVPQDSALLGKGKEASQDRQNEGFFSTDDLLNSIPPLSADFVDVIEKTTATTPLNDDEIDLKPTTDILATSTKLQELKDSLSLTLAQIHLVDLFLRNLSMSKGKKPQVAGSAKGFKSQTLELVKSSLKEDVGRLTKQHAKCVSQDQRDSIKPGILSVELLGWCEEKAANYRKRVSADFGRMTLGAEMRERTQKSKLKKVTYFVLNISKKAEKVGWMIKKRLSDFESLQKDLKARYPSLAPLDIESEKKRRLWKGGSKKAASATNILATYLQKVVDDPEISESEVLRTFVSTDIVASLDGIQLHKPVVEERSATLVGLGSISAGRKPLQQLSKMMKRKRQLVQISEAESGAVEAKVDMPDLLERQHKAGTSSAPTELEDRTSPEHFQDIDEEEDSSDSISSASVISGSDKEEEAEPKPSSEPADDANKLTGSSQAKSVETSLPYNPIASMQMSPMVDSLCSLVTELYEFKEQNLWLKKSAASMILKQCFGAKHSLDKFVESSLDEIVEDESLQVAVSWIRHNLTEVNKSMAMSEKFNSTAEPSRFIYDMLEAALSFIPKESGSGQVVEAKSNLLSIWPEPFGRILGAEAAAMGTSTLFELFQHQTLNKQLVYTLLDALLEVLVESSEDTNK
ncbi:Intermediate filament protein [Chytridiales sp. JEL 0842]|nr:Intermediate filament protein [Chytridiales sp. JEL 0842]